MSNIGNSSPQSRIHHLYQFTIRLPIGLDLQWIEFLSIADLAGVMQLLADAYTESVSTNNVNVINCLHISTKSATDQVSVDLERQLHSSIWQNFR